MHQIKRLWKMVAKDCGWKHPRAWAVRKLWSEKATEAVLELLRDSGGLPGDGQERERGSERALGRRGRGGRGRGRSSGRRGGWAGAALGCASFCLLVRYIFLSFVSFFCLGVQGVGGRAAPV